jgi:nitrate reductase gamma subunit
MGVLISLLTVLVLVLLASLGAGPAGLSYLFGVVLPYMAFAAFVIGVMSRIVYWARSPVPFRVPSTCGQQKTLPWIKHDNLDNPYNLAGVIGRMVLEVLLFRSLFRNTKTEVREGPRITYAAEKLLWAGGLAFHWSFLVIILRHFKYFTEPVPSWVNMIQGLDGFFQVGLPIILISDLVIVAALTFLFLRRVIDSKVRYISLPADYFALFLLLGITISGIIMRYFSKTDIVSVKELALGLMTFQPTIPQGIGSIFFVHLFLVSVLLAYFPFSKLMHMAGVFMSPTRNLANNNRAHRHVNPWDYPVKVHTYEEYEDEFRDKMKAAEMPVEKE